MARKLKAFEIRSPDRASDIITGTIVLTAAGAISSTTGFCPSAAAGVAPGVVKTAAKTARYTVTLDRKYRFIRPVGAPSIIGPTDVAFGNAAGNVAEYRNVGTQSFDVQVFLASSGADTESTSGNIITWAVQVGEF
jgi:hypothetical protein